MPEVYLKEASTDQLVIAYGSNLLRKNFAATVALAATGDMTSGTWLRVDARSTASITT